MPDSEAVDDLMATAAAEFGGIDVVHNNAGVHEAMIADDFIFESMSVATPMVSGVTVPGSLDHRNGGQSSPDRRG